MKKYNILIFGASYGALLGTKLLFGGHSVTLICSQPTADIINADGVRVRLAVKGRTESLEIDTRKLGGTLSASVPGDANPADYDLVILAMQEPQYGSSGVRELLRGVALERKPCVSMMNMPPLPYLKRIPGLDAESLKSCYTEAALWDPFDPELMTLCSPDPQAFRPPGEKANVLQVTLPTNFKVARFRSDHLTEMLVHLQDGIEAIRYETARGDVELPVKLKVHDSVFVPLAKWPMLLAGNYRCATAEGVRSIRDAVGTDTEASRAVYNWVANLCRQLGAAPGDLVPFEKYAAAAQGLSRPSSVARALSAGAVEIERVDRLVQAVGAQFKMHNSVIDETVDLIDLKIALNRSQAIQPTAVSAS